ncbi:hypothetical protein RIR_jg21423.t1 [Rhizophagus irregularis DAOM 181602=DAOM 197198]|nr:hypothetical protein RIR_jg21423.t1 [Rhizophagus irregularis DAOM 181602=DAOM 197198]
MTKSFSKDANILSLEEEEIIKGLDYPVSLFMDTSNEVIKQKYTNSLSKSFMTHESILISGRETLLSKKYDKESGACWTLSYDTTSLALYLNQEKKYVRCDGEE